jgi:Flp pilus assembly protein TadG
MARVRPDEHGAAAVEFALVVPLILVLVFGIIAYAYMFSFRQALSQAASEGARAAVGASSTAVCSGAPSTFTATTCPAQYAARSAVESALSQYSMSCVATVPTSTSQVQCTIPAPATCANSSGHSCITVTLSYPYRSQSLLPTIPGFGFTLPSTLSFTSVVQVS